MFDYNNDSVKDPYRIHVYVVLAFNSRWYEYLIIVHRKWQFDEFVINVPSIKLRADEKLNREFTFTFYRSFPSNANYTYIRRRMKKQCSLFGMIFYFLLEKQQRILHLIEPVVSRKRCNHVSYIANNNVVCTEDSIETEEEETSRSTRGVQSRRAIAGLYTI